MTLAHDRTGSGEPLLLIHGFASRRQIWAPVLPLLEPHREVLALDAPGFGESPADVEHPTPARLAQRIAAFMDDLGLDRAHVAGYSMGGWIALELNKLGRAITTCALAPAGFWNRWERAWCKNSLVALRTTIRLNDGRLEKLNADPRMRRMMNRQQMEHGERLSVEDVVATARNVTASPGFDATLQALHEGHFTGAAEVVKPATIAWGDRDKVLLPRQADRARRAIPQARHLWIPGCGHHPMIDDPETTARAILTS